MLKKTVQQSPVDSLTNRPFTSLAAAGRALRSRFFAPIDIAALVYFRIAFGAIMFWEVQRYLSYGWVGQFYIVPKFQFTYYGLDWIQPWPGDGMYWHFYGLGALALCIVFGFWYRLSAALFFLGFTYVFLLDKTQYLNHLYLVSLVSFLMIFVPAHRAFSIDSIWGARSETAPAWTLWLLRAQIGIPYFYGGVAKIHGDWLRGDTMRILLGIRTDFPLIGSWFTDDRIILLFTYGGSVTRSAGCSPPFMAADTPVRVRCGRCVSFDECSAFFHRYFSLVYDRRHTALFFARLASTLIGSIVPT